MKIPILFYYDLGASTALLCFWRFGCDSQFRVVSESPSSGMGVLAPPIPLDDYSARLMAITDFLKKYSKSPQKRRQPHDLGT